MFAERQGYFGITADVLGQVGYARDSVYVSACCDRCRQQSLAQGALVHRYFIPCLMVFSLLAPDEVSTSGIVAVEVNGQHNEASSGFKPRRAFLAPFCQHFHFSYSGTNLALWSRKISGLSKNPALKDRFLAENWRPIFGCEAFHRWHGLVISLPDVS
ncbi:hypothetical protein D3C81_1470900 [compost metagenome]